MKKLLITVGAFCCLLFTAGGSLAAWPEIVGRNLQRQEQLRPRLAQISSEHPRLFLKKQDLPAIRTRIASDPALSETYGWLLEWARSDHYYENTWTTGYQLEAAAFAYLIEDGDPAILKHCLAIMDYLVTREVGRTNNDMKDWTAPICARGLAVGYDWLYDVLTPDQRQKYGTKAIEAAKVQYDLGTRRHSDYNNHLYLEYGRMTFPGIALLGEGIDDPSAEQLALDGLELMLDHFIPSHNQVGAGDGGWHESMSYHAFFTYEFAHQLEAWSVALGENLWDGFVGLQGDAAWLVYNTRPFDESGVGVADIHTPNLHGGSIASYMPLMQRHYRDGLAGWLADRLRDRDLSPGDRKVYGWWPYLLWTDPTVAPEAPESLPVARLFRGIGWASMRSGWDPDATFALFISGDYFAGHQHMDQNSFVIHKHAPLAIDAGEYGAKATVYHNAVLIGDGQRYYRNDPRRYYAPTEAGGQFDTGDVVAFMFNDHFTYVAGDATNAHGDYSNNSRTTQPVELDLRQFVHLQPDLFVVYDRVKVKDPATPVTWLLHSEDAADIDGDLVTITNGKGRLLSRTVLPLEPTITGEDQVGGTKNRKDYLVRVDSPEGEEHEFLHVLYATEASTDTMPTVESLSVEKDQTVGVRIVIEDWSADVLFNRAGEPGGSVTISENNGRISVTRALPHSVITRPVSSGMPEWF